jgi:DNA invertase Pin-like site-specific DNA recombinase
MIDHDTQEGEDNGKKQRVVLYARFSPRPHASECDSCEFQLAELRRYAGRRRWEIVAEYQDDAVSGKTDYESRPGLFDAAAACKRGYILLVHRIDRLFRDMQHGLAFRATLLHRKIKLMSMHEESACVDTPEGRMMLNLFLIFAQYQRELTSARTREKMKHHQKNLRRMSRFAPFGTRLDPRNSGRLIKDESECATIETIRQCRLKKMTYNGIAQYLNRQQIRCRLAKRWTHMNVKRILAREGID